MKKGTVSNTVYRESYLPFGWILEQVKLRFEIEDEFTRVISQLKLKRNPVAAQGDDIELDFTRPPCNSGRLIF